MRVRHPKSSSESPAPSGYDECLQESERIFDQVAIDLKNGPGMADQRQSFNAEASQLRWFLLPSEARNLFLSNDRRPAATKVPFEPRRYSTEPGRYQLRNYSTISHLTETVETVEFVGNASAISDEPEVQKVDEEEDPEDCDWDSDSENITACINLYDEEDVPDCDASRLPEVVAPVELWKSPVRSNMKPTLEALIRYKMIADGDRVLVCVSGGKDSLSLLHTLHQYQ